MIVQMGYKSTGEAGQDLQLKRACQGVENAAEIQGQERHLGRTANELTKSIGHRFLPVAFWYSTYECPGERLVVRRCYTQTQGGTPMKKQTGTFEICLCHNCASVFYDSPSHRISRVDPLQVIKDTCDCCRSRRGYDFRLRPNTRIRMGQAHYAEYSRPTM